LESTHRIQCRIDILDRNEQLRGSLNAPILQGAVQVDSSADRTTRQLELVVADPNQRVQFAPGSATEAGIFANDFLRAWYEVYVTSLGRWIKVPVFTGPITDTARDGNEVNVMAEGKEVLALDPCFAFRPDHVVKGTRITSAIRQIMDPAGETRYRLPELPDLRLRKRLNVGRQSERWRIAQRLARDIDRQLYYDGMGRLTLRRLASTPQFKFLEGNNSIYASKPLIDFDISDVRNVVVVSGPFQDKPGRNPPVIAYAPAAHPLSAQSLSRNGQPRYMVEFIEAQHAKSRVEATHLARRTLKDRLSAAVELEFECWPIPIFEERDSVAARIDGVHYGFRLRQFTIPLRADASMTVGTLKRVRVKKRRNR
jgi:hypothetical protein